MENATEATPEGPEPRGEDPLSDPRPDRDDPPACPLELQRAPIDRAEILKALEVVERDSNAIAESYASLFSSVRSALSEVSGASVEHMHCFNDVVGRLQESVLDAANKGNRYINSCLRLNEEMKGIELLAVQLKTLRRNVDALDLAVNKLVRFP